MNKLIVAAAVLWGGWWYASKHFKFDDALAHLRKNPQSRFAQSVPYYAGLAYYQRGENAKSQQVFTQLLTDFPTGQYAPKALLRLSEVAEANLDWPTAKDSLARYLEEYPAHPDRQIAEKRFELIRNR